MFAADGRVDAQCANCCEPLAAVLADRFWTSGFSWSRFLVLTADTNRVSVGYRHQCLATSPTICCPARSTC
jgi:hypothetical protein